MMGLIGPCWCFWFGCRLSLVAAHHRFPRARMNTMLKTDWDSAPRPPPVPKVTLPRLSLEGVKARRASKASESKAAAGGVGNGNGGAGDEASSEQQPAPPAAAGTGPAAMEDGNGHGEA